MIETSEQLDTKNRILDSAERLFAERGLETASLRSITSAAGVNLAAVNYHFRSKQALAEAVLARRVAPVNRERLELLGSYMVSIANGTPSLERILETFVAPALKLRRELGKGGAHFLKFMGRLHSEPGEHAREMLKEQFGPVVAQYRDALRRALPGVSETDLAWGIHFTIGAFAHALIGGLLDVYASGVCDPSDTDALVRRVVAYTAAGMRSQVAGTPLTNE